MDLIVKTGFILYCWDKCRAMGVSSLSVDTSERSSNTTAQSSASSTDSGVVCVKQYKQRGGTVFGLFVATGSGSSLANSSETGSTLSPSLSAQSSVERSPPSSENSSNKSCHSRGNSSDNGSTITSSRGNGARILQNTQHPRDTESPKLRPFHRQRSASESISEKLKDTETMKNKELEELWPDHNSLDRNTSQYANNAASVRSAKLATSGFLDIGCQECQRQQSQDTLHSTRTPMGANVSRTLLPKSRSFVLPQRPAFTRLHNNIDRSRTSREDPSCRTSSRICRDRSVPADSRRRRQGTDTRVGSEARRDAQEEVPRRQAQEVHSVDGYVPPVPHRNYLDSAQVLQALQPQKGLPGCSGGVGSAGNVLHPSESAAAAVAEGDCKVTPSVSIPRRYSLDASQVLHNTAGPAATAGTTWNPPASAGPASSCTQPCCLSRNNRPPLQQVQLQNPLPSCGMRDTTLLMGGCLDLPFHTGAHPGVRHGSSQSSILHVSLIHSFIISRNKFLFQCLLCERVLTFVI